jgi:hypothetical protein
MNKKETLTNLLNRGYKAHDTDGILYVDITGSYASGIKEIRSVMKELDYKNSWGIKPVIASVTDDSDDETSAPDMAVSSDLHSMSSEDITSVSALADSSAQSHDKQISTSADFYENTSEDSMSDDSEKSDSYEQYSLFDMMK